MGEFIYDTKNGLITLTIPREFLETAQYPITIDPTVINTTTTANALLNSGGRKIVADRYGNLVAVMYTNTTATFEARGSADGGITWPFSATISAAAKNTSGFSIDMDAVTSVVHVVNANNGEDQLEYTQLFLRYNGTALDNIAASAITVISSITTHEALWNPVIIAARTKDPGQNWFSDAGEFATSVPIVFFFSGDSAANKDDSSLYFTRCKIANDVSAINGCRTAGNWTATQDEDSGGAGAICSLSTNPGNTVEERFSLAVAQT